LTKLKGNAPPAEVPVFDEWFSERVLAAWSPQILTFEDHNVGPSALSRAQPVDGSISRLQDASRAFLIVAFVSFCHICSQEDPKVSRLWYLSKKPFDGGQRIHLNFEGEDDTGREALLGLFGLNAKTLEDAIMNKQGNHRSNESMKGDFDKLGKESSRALVDGFLENLRGDIGVAGEETGANVHKYALRALCNSSKESICDDSHGDWDDHTVHQFCGSSDGFDFDEFERGFRDFLENHEWRKAWTAQKTPNSKTSTGKKSSTAKKRARKIQPEEPREAGEDDIEADFGSMSLDPEEAATTSARAEFSPAYSPTTRSPPAKRELFRKSTDE
jgi:hypothetical protein